ncbi:DUF2332 domain-containing protein [Nocardioides sp. Y6]|uniref:DUF2332 domain-containing protein n=1 Tax=Nocardioides malaquae TaxID=2773426 RepID=A0ABR9RSV8_9ACTN|nr:DUF2332 domain-containing protein [Nocardioides malaquae]MBE7324658.1 DUF2332 domain-containing protein [Nocardioides malaquae]
MTLTIAEVQAGCEWQRRLCEKNGAPTYVALIDELLARLGRDDVVTKLLTSEEQDPVQSALCLRLFGAVNRVALAQSAPWIRQRYPVLGGETDTSRVAGEFIDFLKANLAQVSNEMKIGVQTNEVSRAAPLSAAINFVATEIGLPVRLLEVGASGGLNLLMDQYYVDAGTSSWGPADSPLKLVGQFAHGAPPTVQADVVERRGCDLNPIDVHQDASAQLLESFVWPEHVDRGRRVRAAIKVARSQPPLRIDRSDATPWVKEVARGGDVGVATVVFHSIVLPYFDPAARDEFVSTVRELGESATEDRPFAWVSMEPTADDSSVVELTCELWPTGRRMLLGRMNPHGMGVSWHPVAQ